MCMLKQAANHGYHCFDREFLLAGACAALAFLAVFVYATHATQAIAFEWKLGLRDGFVDALHKSTFYLLTYLLALSRVLVSV